MYFIVFMFFLGTTSSLKLSMLERRQRSDLMHVDHKCSPGKNSPGEQQGCCTVANPCPYHVGDCDSDDQCQGNLKCQLSKTGEANYGYSSGEVDVCEKEESFKKEAPPTGHRCAPGTNSPGEIQGCCTVADPCPLHIGDCGADEACQGELICPFGMGHANEYGYTNEEVNLCETPQGVRPLGHRCAPGPESPGEKQSCCTVADPCPIHVGDCDTDNECKGELICDHTGRAPGYGYANGEVNLCDVRSE